METEIDIDITATCDQIRQTLGRILDDVQKSPSTPATSDLIKTAHEFLEVLKSFENKLRPIVEMEKKHKVELAELREEEVRLVEIIKIKSAELNTIRERVEKGGGEEFDLPDRTSKKPSQA